jgi:RNA polymerase sigma-70 factor (ECF subfamily)
MATVLTESTLERLYRDRYAVYCRMAVAVTGDVGRAHEAVQEAFIRALRLRDGYRGTGTVEGWLWRIVLREAYGARGADPSAPLPEELGTTLPMPDRNPGLAEAVAALSPRRRLVVFLRYYADLSLPQIAEAVGISEGTVSATLAQAHARLRASLVPAKEER